MKTLLKILAAPVTLTLTISLLVWLCAGLISHTVFIFQIASAVLGPTGSGGPADHLRDQRPGPPGDRAGGQFHRNPHAGGEAAGIETNSLAREKLPALAFAAAESCLRFLTAFFCFGDMPPSGPDRRGRSDAPARRQSCPSVQGSQARRD